MLKLVPVFSCLAVRRLRLAVLAVLLGVAVSVHAAALAVPSTPLPPEIEAALARAKVPPEAVAMLVVDVQASATPRLAHRAQEPMNPASVMKLVTTFAGLELLGPAHVWNTPVYLDGTLQGSSLHGNVYIRGQGDPALVMERLWLLLRRLQGQGVQTIAGDIVLDRSAWDMPAHDPAQFDGEPQRPYNAAPDALLVNFKSVVMGFVPDASAGMARVQYDPPLAGVHMPPAVPLASPGTPCGDWRAGLRAELGDAARFAFAGAYPLACGERSWAVAYADPDRYAARAVEGLWRALGGKLTGTVRDGRVPAALAPAFISSSPALAEVVRDINKYSNNVMAQQLFMALAQPTTGVATQDGARQALHQWWRARFGGADLPVVGNGAGLGREDRISAQALARMLQAAWAAPVMPELVASLPIAGIDGTLRRGQHRVVGRAHLKTGSLRDVLALAGYVHAANGRRYVLVALVNHRHAPAARPVLEALLDWTARE